MGLIGKDGGLFNIIIIRNKLRKIKLLFYYYFITRLPNSRIFPISRKIRVAYTSKVLKITLGGEKAFFENNIYIGNGNNLIIGENCQINENVFLQSVKIGDNTLIAPNVSILSKSHEYNKINVPIIDQGDRADNPVVIGSNCWIGRSVIIFPGVVIGENSIIGAGSIVTKSIPKSVVAVGNPCKIIKSRIYTNDIK
jgi:acetyltransferase-like isoleucine patch superfamily enzyme